MRKSLLLIVIPALVCCAAHAATFRVEIDYMADTDHSHEPSPLVLDSVIQMFACQGHTLILELDDELDHHDLLVRDPDNCQATLFNYSGTDNSYGAIKDEHFDHSGDSGWHYCIFGHQYEDTECNATTSSGLANGKRNFLVSLGAFCEETASPFQQAATLAHEFGHNLGLSHCGTQNCGDDEAEDYVGPHVTNMPSTMSYRYQLSGVRTRLLDYGLTIEEAPFKEINYSHGRMCTLDEDDLDEGMGTGMIWTDWDCDGVLESSVAQDTSESSSSDPPWCDSTGNRTSVRDYNEWANLEDGASMAFDMRPEVQERLRLRQERLEREPCITARDWAVLEQRLGLRSNGCSRQPSVEPCISARNVYVGGPAFFEIGTCRLPFLGVRKAHDFSPPASVFFLQPGVYDETGVLILHKTGKYFCERKDESGVALIR